MIFSQEQPKGFKLFSFLCSCFLLTACVESTHLPVLDEIQVQQTIQPKNQVEYISSSLVQSAKIDAITKANALYCAVDSAKKKLDLTDVKLIRQPNIPLMYQGFNNIEGPVWSNGALYYSNMGSHLPDENGDELSNQSTLWRWVLGSKPQVWLKDTEAGTNGLALDNKGNLIAARQLDGSLSTINWHTKKISPIVSIFKKKRFNSPNDLTIDYANTLYFTDPNWNTPSNINVTDTQGGGEAGSVIRGQRIYRVMANGAVKATQVTELVPELRDKPNGIILSLDQQKLIVGGLQGLWVFDLLSDEVSNPRRLLTTPIDGLGKDCSGNIYVTTTREIPERKDSQAIVILDQQLNEVGSLKVPGIQIVTNVAFGGADRKTLFVTGLTAPMDGDKPRQCGQAPCLPAGIYTTKLNVQGFPF